jgi:3-hydroxyisobutyrate dehydrogenase-like beta-hydroxyacid dehydrogenase
MKAGHESNRALGWIGVGKMGNPMATRLMEAGHGMVICDPIPENRSSLVARGAVVADTVGNLASQCDTIFMTIPNDDALGAIIFNSGGADDGFMAQIRPGTVVIEMSTVSPQLSEKIAKELARREVGYLRCPVSGSTALASSGQLTALASGDLPSWEQSCALLDVIASRKFYLGSGDEARYMKLVLNTLVGATSSILGEALVLGAKGGLGPAQMMEVIAESAVASPLIKYKKDMMSNMDFAPAFSVTQMEKDFMLITDAGRANHIPMVVANTILQQYIAAANVGYADQDFFALFGWMREGSGLNNPD